MATAKRSTTRKATRVGTPAVARAKKVLRKIESEIPSTLEEFSKRVRNRLGRLERSVEKAEASYRRQAARVLRQASHQLGRFEAEGERRWTALTAEARKEALQVLRRMEKALEAGKPSAAKKAPRRKTTRARSA